MTSRGLCSIFTASRPHFSDSISQLLIIKTDQFTTNWVIVIFRENLLATCIPRSHLIHAFIGFGLLITNAELGGQAVQRPNPGDEHRNGENRGHLAGR